MVVGSSEVEKSVVRWPPTSGTHPHHYTLALNIEVMLFIIPSKAHVGNSCFAMELAVIEHCFESDLCPVRRLNVF